MKPKSYPHVTGLYGDNGENPGALAVAAVLDPSPNYPEVGRIIVGSPTTTPTMPGYIPNLGGFNGGPDAIERLASTLTEAVRDVRAAMAGNQGPEPVTRLDLDDLERKARATVKGAFATVMDGPTTLALIAEIRSLRAVADRAVTIADEAFGLGPVEPIDATLSRIERGISEQHIRSEQLREQAAKVPGLSADLNAARWERDAVLQREPAAGQALREIDRLLAANRHLESIAKAATGFVDEQGKRIAMTPDGDMAIGGRHDFAGEQFAMLVDAVKAAGR